MGGLLAGSVPIVTDNRNSLDSLPDPNSALLIRTADGKSLQEKAQQPAYHAFAELHIKSFFSGRKEDCPTVF